MCFLFFFSVLPVVELESVVSRLSSSSCPLDSEVKQLIHRSNLSKLVSIYQSVMIQKQNINSLTGTTESISQQQPSSITSSVTHTSPSSKGIPSLNQSSCDLMQEIIPILQEEVRNTFLTFSSLAPINTRALPYFFIT